MKPEAIRHAFKVVFISHRWGLHNFLCLKLHTKDGLQTHRSSTSNMCAANSLQSVGGAGGGVVKYKASCPKTKGNSDIDSQSVFCVVLLVMTQGTFTGCVQCDGTDSEAHATRYTPLPNAAVGSLHSG